MRFRYPEGQVARWIEILQEYHFTLEFRGGKHHQNADGLSRRPCYNHNCVYCDRIETCENRNLDENAESNGNENVSRPEEDDHLVARVLNTENTVTFEEFSNDDIKKSQLRDPNVGPIVRWFSGSPERPEWEDVSSKSEETKVYWAQWDCLMLRENIYRVWESPNGRETCLQLIVPKTLSRMTVSHQDILVFVKH